MFIILDILAARGGASLHARGRAATIALLNELPMGCAGPMLEIGCGTGETAVQLCGYRGTVVAADASALMLRSAVDRSKWCGVRPRIQPVQVSRDGKLPFATSAFAAVVIESVLAIQGSDTLRPLVREIGRVVKPRGRVLINETVWMEETPRHLAEEINQRAAELAGLIQAVEAPFDVHDWVELFETSGLSLIRKQRLDDLESDSALRQEGRSLIIRSRAFTAWRRLRALMTSEGVANQKRLKRVLAELAPPSPCMEGILFVLEQSNQRE